MAPQPPDNRVIKGKRITQAALIPLAYTIGTDFKPGPRVSLEESVHWNRW